MNEVLFANLKFVLSVEIFLYYCTSKIILIYYFSPFLSMNFIKVFCFLIYMNILFICYGIAGKIKCKTGITKIFRKLTSSMQKVNIKII